MFSGFTHVVACVRTSFPFLRPNDIPLHISILCLAFHLFMNICVVFSFWLLQMKLLWTLIYKSLCWYVFSSPLIKYLRVELLSYMVTLYLTYWQSVKLFPKVAEPFYNPSNSEGGFQLCHILANTCHCLFGFNHPSEHEVSKLWVCKKWDIIYML